MGADVIKVEPPAGDDARRIGPFLDDLPHRDRSLFFWFYNLNKRSLTLDLKHSRGADILLQLARSADVVIESFAPGTLDQLGLGWDVLHRENPALVLCSIAPFGQTGPYRDYRRRRHRADRARRDALRQRLSRITRRCVRWVCRRIIRRRTSARSP